MNDDCRRRRTGGDDNRWFGDDADLRFFSDTVTLLARTLADVDIASEVNFTFRWESEGGDVGESD